MERIVVSEWFRTSKTNCDFEVNFSAKIDLLKAYEEMAAAVKALDFEDPYTALWLQDLGDSCEAGKIDYQSTLESETFVHYVPAMIKAIAKAFPEVSFEAHANYDDQRCYYVDDFKASYSNHHLIITEQFDSDDYGYFCPECGSWIAPSLDYFDDETVVCDGCEESFDVSNLKFVPPFVEVHEYEIR